VTAEEFVRMIIAESPIWPYNDYNACHFCGSGWAEDTFADWLRREQDADGKYLGSHHDRDCVWVIAHQVEGVTA
jgi:hypothetical protein